jgi:hypothetical protein
MEKFAVMYGENIYLEKTTQKPGKIEEKEDLRWGNLVVKMVKRRGKNSYFFFFIFLL